MGKRARNERLGAGITRRRFLWAISAAATTWIALSGSLGCEQTARTGAPEVATWQLLAGSGPDGLEPVGSVPCNGFETVVTPNTDHPYIAVKAKDSSDRVLGTSEAVKPLEQASSVPTDKAIS